MMLLLYVLNKGPGEETCSLVICSLAVASSFSRPAILCLSCSTSVDAFARDLATCSHTLFSHAYSSLENPPSIMQ